MIDKLNAIGDQTLKEIESATSLDTLDQVRISVLGKKGALSEVLKGLGSVEPQQRPRVGGAANEWKRKIETALELRKESLEQAALTLKLQSEKLDISAPSRLPHRGSLHLITQVTQRMIQVFSRLGFDVTTGPEVETEYLNFEAVNIPANHPARDMQDTFWLRDFKSKNPKQNLLLRTHTSPMQVRYMEKNNPPLRIIVPGRVYRYEATDASHEIQFHQIEGLMVDKNISLANLKAVFEEFFKKFFSAKKVEVRFRPGYFPFVEPGIEVDIRLGSSPKWLEVAGAGMVHPKVFEAADYIPSDWQGFAFGMGLERLTMLCYGINDIRLFYSSDFRFLKQF